MDVSDRLNDYSYTYHVTCWDQVVLIYSVIFYFIDLGADSYVLYDYYHKQNYAYFWWTLAFIIVPSVIMTSCSIRMYYSDWENGSKKSYALLRIVLCLITFFQIAPLLRYIDSLIYGCKSKKAEKNENEEEQKKNCEKMLNEKEDAALLRVLECYLESSPQQALQIALLLVESNFGSDLHRVSQCILIVFSFLSMGSSMASYNDSIRLDQKHKKQIFFSGNVAQFFWHMFITVSRILTLAALIFMSSLWAGVAALVHWMGMTAWIHLTSRNDFCDNNAILDLLFSLSFGLVYIFNFVGLRDVPKKNYHIIFYGVCFIENFIVCVIWYFKSPLPNKDWVYYFFTVFPVVSFLFGIIFLLVYYKYLHPNLYD